MAFNPNRIEINNSQELGRDVPDLVERVAALQEDSDQIKEVLDAQKLGFEKKYPNLAKGAEKNPIIDDIEDELASTTKKAKEANGKEIEPLKEEGKSFVQKFVDSTIEVGDTVARGEEIETGLNKGATEETVNTRLAGSGSREDSVGSGLVSESVDPNAREGLFS